MNEGKDLFRETGKQIDANYEAAKATKQAYSVLRQQHGPELQEAHETISNLEGQLSDAGNTVLHLRKQIGNRNRVIEGMNRGIVERASSNLRAADKRKIDFLLDSQNIISYISSRYLKKTGYEEEEVIGKEYTQFVNGDEDSGIGGDSKRVLTIICKEDPKKPGEVRELRVLAEKTPVYSFEGKLLWHTTEKPGKFHVYTRVLLKKAPADRKKTNAINALRKNIAQSLKEAKDYVLRRDRERGTEDNEEDSETTVMEELEDNLPNL
tara:strand:- start:14649 stop:15446 length:798 start_codon:yes stop_codon:yes gene_type:complete